MTIAMTIATTIRIAHSTTVAVRAALRLAPGAPPARRRFAASPGPDPSRPPDPLPDGGGVAPVGVSTTVGVSTSSVTEDAPLLHPRRSDAPRTDAAPPLILRHSGSGAGAGRRRGAETESSGGATTAASGPSAEQQPFEPGRLADREHDLPGAVLRAASADSWGWLSTTHVGARREPEGDARVVGPRAVHEVAGRRRRRATPGRSARRWRGPRGRGRRGTAARPSARWHHAATYHAPNAWKTRHGSMTRVVISSRANEK